MKLNDLLKLRQVGGEYMIINPYSEEADMTQVISLNETAAWLWQQVEGREFTAEDLVEPVCGEYEVDRATAENDIRELCDEWLHKGLAVEESRK